MVTLWERIGSNPVSFTLYLCREHCGWMKHWVSASSSTQGQARATLPLAYKLIHLFLSALIYIYIYITFLCLDDYVKHAHYLFEEKYSKK